MCEKVPYLKASFLDNRSRDHFENFLILFRVLYILSMNFMKSIVRTSRYTRMKISVKFDSYVAQLGQKKDS